MRLVPIAPWDPAPPAPPGPVDVRIVDGIITEIAASLDRATGEEVLDGEGRWAMPGVWDQHVHFTQWAQTVGRLDLSGAASAEQVLDAVAAQLRADPPAPGAPLIGFGFRDALWSRVPDVGHLDAVAGKTPVVLLSADMHSGWLSSAAMDRLGVSLRQGLVREHEWFDVVARMGELPAPPLEAGLRRALTDATARGVVGMVDLEFAANHLQWPERVAAGMDLLRVRTGTYTDDLDSVLEAGLRSGQEIGGGRGLVTMGPLKIISDGSLNTRTAFCYAPYPDAADPAHPYGRQSVPVEELVALLDRARRGGLVAAVHAIGDGANTLALDAFAATGARGSIEHAQLMRREDVLRLAQLGVAASVQPAHLLDDRDVAEQVWAGHTDRTFVLREMLDAGVELRFGSDAPVARLDPWTAMAAAVHRSADEREPWHGEQQLSVAEALAASTDGRGTLRSGQPGDVILLEQDPYGGRRPATGPAGASAEAATGPAGASAEAAARLRHMPVAATIVAGRPVHHLS